MSIFAIAKAVNAYKARSGNKTAATRVEKGRIQLVSVTYPNGSESKIEELSEWMPVADFCEWIAAQ